MEITVTRGLPAGGTAGPSRRFSSVSRGLRRLLSLTTSIRGHGTLSSGRTGFPSQQDGCFRTLRGNSVISSGELPCGRSIAEPASARR